MAAAEKLFADGRFHEITLDDVVRRAHVGKGTVYRYFKNKDDLFFQTATRGFDELCALLNGSQPNGQSVQDQLLDACGQVGEFFSKRRLLLRMMQSDSARAYMFRKEMRGKWQQNRRRLVAAVAAIIGRGVAEGSIRGDVPAETLASFLLGMLRTRSRELCSATAQPFSMAEVVELFFYGAALPKRTVSNA